MCAFGFQTPSLEIVFSRSRTANLLTETEYHNGCHTKNPPIFCSRPSKLLFCRSAMPTMPPSSRHTLGSPAALPGTARPLLPARPVLPAESMLSTGPVLRTDMPSRRTTPQAASAHDATAMLPSAMPGTWLSLRTSNTLRCSRYAMQRPLQPLRTMRPRQLSSKSLKGSLHKALPGAHAYP